MRSIQFFVSDELHKEIREYWLSIVKVDPRNLNQYTPKLNKVYNDLIMTGLNTKKSQENDNGS